MSTLNFDEFDKKILKYLQEDSSISNIDILVLSNNFSSTQI